MPPENPGFPKPPPGLGDIPGFPKPSREKQKTPTMTFDDDDEDEGPKRKGGRRKSQLGKGIFLFSFFVLILLVIETSSFSNFMLFFLGIFSLWFRPLEYSCERVVVLVRRCRKRVRSARECSDRKMVVAWDCSGSWLGLRWVLNGVCLCGMGMW